MRLSASGEKTKRYVLLPAQGLVGEALESRWLTSERIFDPEGPGGLFDGVIGGEELRAWSSALSASEEPRTRVLRILQSFEDDGPKLVEATAGAERLLRAAGLRLVPVTTYRLAARGEAYPFADDAAAAASARSDFLRHLTTRMDGSGPLGIGVRVGVVDSGVDAGHPDLQQAISGGRCFVLGENNLDYGPSNGPKGGHGTHVAGIIAGRGLSNGVPGVAPGAELRSYRVFPKADATGASNAAIINAIRAAVDDECDIVNLSLGGNSAKEDGVRDAVDFAWQNGVVCIAAAGNGGRKTVTFPARHPNAIAVSAVGKESLIPPGAEDHQYVALPRAQTDEDVFLAGFSNVGPQIDFAGPGVWIVSTVPGGGYAAMSGTSMAAPAISGFAAVVLSRASGILTQRRNAERAEAIFRLLVGRARPYGFGSFDFEGYGVPLP